MKPFSLILAAFFLHVGITSAQTGLDSTLAPFYHGVASGDPLSDKVMIWTRVTTQDSGDLMISWKIASDSLLSQVVDSGNVITNDSSDFTVKVDVNGLQPDTWYYYQFQYKGDKSLTGRTRTFPTGNNDKVRFAVVSCARAGAGNYYNPYLDIANRNDIQAVVHLGDYIYETSGGVTGHGIQIFPTSETISLEDYRARYNTYRLDPDLRKVHQRYPFINVWDDHETANDSWQNGAEAHDPNTEGPWASRKEAAQQAYFEWLPIRPKAPGSYSIYRSFSIGNLVDLIMIDSRLEARDEQATLGDQAAYSDTSRTLLGQPQMQWLKNQLSSTQSKWKIIGNQVMFAPLRLGSLYFSNDQWDGYQGDRNKIISHVVDNSIKNVAIITGDIHTSWANDIPDDRVSYNPNTGAGSAFVEFVGPSISTGSPVSNSLLPLIRSTNSHIKYTDLEKYGYMILDIDSHRIQCNWYYVSTVSDSNFTVSQPVRWYVYDGESFLRDTLLPVSVYNLQDHEAADFKMTVHPNPVQNILRVEFQSQKQGQVDLSLIDLVGRTVHHESMTIGSKFSNFQIKTGDLPEGTYFLRVALDGQKVDAKTIIKSHF